MTDSIDPHVIHVVAGVDTRVHVQWVRDDGSVEQERIYSRPTTCAKAQDWVQGNIFIAGCGAKFTTYEAMVAHVRQYHEQDE